MAVEPDPARRLMLALEIEELRMALAATQDQCVELAVDAGELHALVEQLQVELAQVREERDAWRAEAQRRGAGEAA